MKCVDNPVINDSDNLKKIKDKKNKKHKKIKKEKKLMIIIDRFNQYLKYGVEISLPINKMYHKYENQYRLEYGTNSMELYDVEMM